MTLRKYVPTSTLFRKDPEVWLTETPIVEETQCPVCHNQIRFAVREEYHDWKKHAELLQETLDAFSDDVMQIADEASVQLLAPVRGYFEAEMATRRAEIMNLLEDLKKRFKEQG
jgi:hypothetical protein